MSIPTSDPNGRPELSLGKRRALVGLLLLEAAVMLVLGVVVLVGLLAGHRQAEVGFAITELVFCLLVAAVFAGLARGFGRGGRRGVGLALTLNLVALPIAFNATRSGRWPLAVPILLVALPTLWLIFQAAVADGGEPDNRRYGRDSGGQPDAE